MDGSWMQDKRARKLEFRKFKEGIVKGVERGTVGGLEVT
jgi:hypothetical protein